MVDSMAGITRLYHRGPRGISPASTGENGCPPLCSTSERRSCASSAAITQALIERVPVVAAVCHQAERICPSRSESMRIDRRAISAGGGVGAAARVGGAAGATGGGAITAAGPALRADFLRAGRALMRDHRPPREVQRGAHRRCQRASSRPATHRGPARTLRNRR